jgi:hypothetical protein
MEYGIYETQIYSVKYYLIYSKQEFIHATLVVAHTTSIVFILLLFLRFPYKYANSVFCDLVLCQVTMCGLCGSWLVTARLNNLMRS